MRTSSVCAVLALVGLLALVPARALADSDDTLCAAIQSSPVDWPVGDYALSTYAHFDSVFIQPWFCKTSEINYLQQYGPFDTSWESLGGTNFEVCAYHPDVNGPWAFSVATPMGRMFNALSFIVFANADGIGLDRTRDRHDFNYYNSMTKWMSAAVYQYAFRFKGICYRKCNPVGSGSCTYATTWNRILNNHDRTEFYQTAYYELNAIQRAGLIVHETRHAAGRSHDGESCLNGSSCDETWTSAGANTWEMLWYAAFKWSLSVDQQAYPDIRSSMARDRAEAEFERVKTYKFDTEPEWELSDFI
ncbi:MAG: hypothetical protein WCE62_17975, partial [Polyangiales bacterium]